MCDTLRNWAYKMPPLPIRPPAIDDLLLKGVMGMKKYESLKELYPEYISLDKMRIICRISKRSASYLIQNKIIPSTDTGKQTWRYQIALDDVITYLRRREQLGSMIPRGQTTSYRKRLTRQRVKHSSSLLNADSKLAKGYFSGIYADYPDVLTTADIKEMTGLSGETIRRLIQSGDLESMLIAKSKRVVLKESLMQLVITHRFIKCKCHSDTFTKLLRGFDLWKDAKSSR